MERGRQRWIVARFQGLELPPGDVLDIPDDYEFMDPQLLELLGATLEPELAWRIAAEWRRTNSETGYTGRRRSA